MVYLVLAILLALCTIRFLKLDNLYRRAKELESKSTNNKNEYCTFDDPLEGVKILGLIYKKLGINITQNTGNFKYLWIRHKVYTDTNGINRYREQELINFQLLEIIELANNIDNHYDKEELENYINNKLKDVISKMEDLFNTMKDYNKNVTYADIDKVLKQPDESIKEHKELLNKLMK